MATSVPIATRSSRGISINSGLPDCTPLDVLPWRECCGPRTMLFSPDGKYFAYIYINGLKILRTDTWNDVAFIEGAKPYHLAFSPLSTYLMTWEPFTTNKANPQGSPNLNIYKSEDGSFVKSFVHKKQINWEPQWSNDEHIFSRMINTDVIFYEDCNFERIVHRINCDKIASYSLSPADGMPYVLCSTAGVKGQPSFARIFKYPNFDVQQAIATKTFFQADKVDFYWNCKGTHALVLTSVEVDKTGGSYYGKQGLYFIASGGETSTITLGKEGPIYSVAWSPKGHEFCAVYGFTPAKGTIFNLKCEPVFELGSLPKNAIYYNPHGNILLVGGFGNLRGHIELWNVNARKLIGTCRAPDSTHLEWCPDGKHFLTATTAPRLRVDNGFKIWHYSGTLLYEKLWEKETELYDVCFQKASKADFKEPTITSEKVQGIETKQPKPSQEAYRPPSARYRQVHFSLHDEDAPSKIAEGTKPSKAAIKQRKKREARKARKTEEGDVPPATPAAPSTVSQVEVNLTGDPEKDKKIKNIKKKLDAIEKLKEQQAQGKTLEVNQISKISTENDLLKELEQLQV